MPGKLSLALALLALISTAQAHSLEKRQTTVSFEGTYEDIRELVIRITLAFTLAAVLVVVVAPVFGYKVDLLVSQISSLAAASDTAEAAAAEDAGYGATAGGYAGYAASGYAAAARRLMGGSWTSVLHSIDLVDTAFNYMDIEEESCRLKTVCEMEAYAVAHPLAKLAINTINSNLRGLDRYQDAIDAGMNGQDCAFLYDQCQFSYFGY